MPLSTDLVSALLSTTRGRIAAANIVNSLNFVGSVPKDGIFRLSEVSGLLTAWEAAIRANALWPIPYDYKSVDAWTYDILEHLRPLETEPKSKTGSTKGSFSFCTALPLRRFVAIVSEDTSRMLNDKITTPVQDISVEQWHEKSDIIADINDNFNITNIKNEGVLGRDCLWLTTKTAVKRAFLPQTDSRRSRADIYRDTVGMVHWSAEEIYVAVYLPIAIVEQVTLCRPSFAHARTHSRFRTLPDRRRPASTTRWGTTWGITVHLGRLERNAPSLDGVVEQISAPIKGPLPKKAELRFELLGPLTQDTRTEPREPRKRPQPLDTDVDGRFLDRLLAPVGRAVLSTTDLTNRLLAIP
jgi:hypothetical protein